MNWVSVTDDNGKPLDGRFVAKVMGDDVHYLVGADRDTRVDSIIQVSTGYLYYMPGCRLPLFAKSMKELVAGAVIHNCAR